MSSRIPAWPFQTSGSSNTSSISTASGVKQETKDSTSPVSRAQQYLAMRSWMATRSSMPGWFGLDMRFPLEAGRAAVDQKVDAGDEGGIAAGQEQHGGRDLLRRPHAVHRRVADHLFADRRNGLRRQPRGATHDRRLGGTGTHHVHADPLADQFRREAASQRAQPRLAGRIDRARRDALQ